MAPVRAGLPAVVAALQLLACSSAPLEHERSVLAGNLAHTLLILPLNLAVDMPSELEGLSPLVWRELERYLRAQGKELKTVAPADARRLWIESIRKARAAEGGARADFHTAARLLVLELTRYAHFDIVLFPSLLIREAVIQGRRAVWDGIKRDVEFEAYSFEARSVAASVPVEGTAPAASLHVVVLDSQGRELQEAIGGLDLLVRIRVRTPSETSAGQAAPDPGRGARFEFATRTDLFANPEHLREGIARSLAPFLPPLRMD